MISASAPALASSSAVTEADRVGGSEEEEEDDDEKFAEGSGGAVVRMYCPNTSQTQ